MSAPTQDSGSRLTILVAFAIFLYATFWQAGKMDDCTERGGTPASKGMFGVVCIDAPEASR